MMFDLAAFSTFHEFAAILLLAAALGFVGLALRQPLIVVFIVAGIVAGPAVLGIAKSEEAIELFSKLGVAVLLFLVGLQLDLKMIRTVGPVALYTGLGQVLFTSVVGFVICVALGLSVVEAIYVSVALTFSSTIIIVKLLSDKGEVDALHGRIALGFLIVQDLVVVLAMIVLSAATLGPSEQSMSDHLIRVVVFGALLLACVALFMRYAAHWLSRMVVRSPELVIVFGIGWAAVLAAAADAVGLSLELGGLLAGVSLASTPYREAIASRLASVRDFMLLFFFVGLGLKLDLNAIGSEVYPAIALSLFVLIGNPLIVMIIMGIMGYRKRTGFLAGLTVAQISEFSLIFVAMGLQRGDLSESIVGLVTLVGLVTIGSSTYMILYSQRLFAVVEPLLGMFEKHYPSREPTVESGTQDDAFDTVIFGLGRYGGNIALGLARNGRRVLGFDFDPAVVASFERQDVTARYGSVDDAELFDQLPLDRVEWVISAIHPRAEGPTLRDHREILLNLLRQKGYRGKVALPAYDARDAVRLRNAGVDFVMMPFADASKHVVDTLVSANVHSPAQSNGVQDRVE